MDLPRRTHLYAFVHPVFWPWLWFQLWRLQAWITSNKRDVLFKVDRFGNLYITSVSDPAADPSLYTYTPPRVPAWAKPALASDTPDDILLAAARAWPAPCALPRLPPLRMPAFAPDTS